MIASAETSLHSVSYLTITAQIIRPCAQLQWCQGPGEKIDHPQTYRSGGSVSAPGVVVSTQIGPVARHRSHQQVDCTTIRPRAGGLGFGCRMVRFFEPKCFPPQHHPPIENARGRQPIRSEAAEVGRDGASAVLELQSLYHLGGAGNGQAFQGGHAQAGEDRRRVVVTDPGPSGQRQAVEDHG